MSGKFDLEDGVVGVAAADNPECFGCNYYCKIVLGGTVHWSVAASIGRCCCSCGRCYFGETGLVASQDWSIFREIVLAVEIAVVDDCVVDYLAVDYFADG